MSKKESQQIKESIHVSMEELLDTCSMPEIVLDKLYAKFGRTIAYLVKEVPLVISPVTISQENSLSMQDVKLTIRCDVTRMDKYQKMLEVFRKVGENSKEVEQVLKEFHVRGD